ncbi:MAG: GtrA family protein [Microbacterium sp.]
MLDGPIATKVKEAGAFLVIGGIAFVVDAAVYNLLVFWVTGHGVLFHAPLAAKIIAIAVASVVTYIGNRYLTYSSRHLPRRASRYAIFALCNLIAIGLQLGCLGFSRYVLGLDSVLSDNIAGTVIGQALATVFRFVSYDRWVFPHETTGPQEADRTA